MTGLRTLALSALAGGALFCAWQIAGLLGLFAPPVRARRLMTDMERRTIGFLERAVPNARVHAQVSMGALIDPRGSIAGQARRRLFFSYASKRIDYVLEDRRTGHIIALVELDDWTHNPLADRQRDRLTAAAGYLTIRLPASERPTFASVSARVRGALGMDDPYLFTHARTADMRSAQRGEPDHERV